MNDDDLGNGKNDDEQRKEFPLRTLGEKAADQNTDALVEGIKICTKYRNPGTGEGDFYGLLRKFFRFELEDYMALAPSEFHKKLSGIRDSVRQRTELSGKEMGYINVALDKFCSMYRGGYA